MAFSSEKLVFLLIVIIKETVQFRFVVLIVNELFFFITVVLELVFTHLD